MKQAASQIDDDTEVAGTNILEQELDTPIDFDALKKIKSNDAT